VVVRHQSVEAHRLDLADEPSDDRRVASDLGLREDGMQAHRR